MKRIIVLLLIVMLMLGACSPSSDSESPYLWEVVKSPKTGRYYEVYSGRGISEITEHEYDAYKEDEETRGIYMR